MFVDFFVNAGSQTRNQPMRDRDLERKGVPFRSVTSEATLSTLRWASRS